MNTRLICTLVMAALLILRSASPASAQLESERSLFTGFDADKHAIKGEWEIIAGQVRITDANMAVAELPGRVEGSYRLIAEFTRTGGTNSIGFILPVGSRQCIVNLAVFDGEAHGIATVDGGLARDNVTTIRPGTLKNGRRYKLIVDVSVDGDAATIQSQLNGDKFLSWSGSQDSLGLLPFWEIRRKDAVGLFANCSVIFHSATVGPIAGEITSLDPNPKPMMANAPALRTRQNSTADASQTVAFEGKEWRTGNANRVTIEEFRGRTSLHVVGREAAFVPIVDASFGNGVIEVDIASNTFSGVGFRGNDAGTVVEKVYFRPQNSGTAKHGNTVQYSMLGRPQYGWRTLRENFPGKYESGADVAVNEWLHVRVVIEGSRATVYVNNREQPVLTVNELLGDRSQGTVGVWGWNSYFSNFSFTPGK